VVVGWAIIVPDCSVVVFVDEHHVFLEWIVGRAWVRDIGQDLCSLATHGWGKRRQNAITCGLVERLELLVVPIRPVAIPTITGGYVNYAIPFSLLAFDWNNRTSCHKSTERPAPVASGCILRI
jgi:hypothetical protein